MDKIIDKIKAKIGNIIIVVGIINMICGIPLAIWWYNSMPYGNIAMPYGIYDLWAIVIIVAVLQGLILMGFGTIISILQDIKNNTQK